MRGHALPRTSQTHPLRIDSLPFANGRIGLTLCPGKQGDSVFGAPWARDLPTDLDAVEAWGAAAVVTLIEAAEAETLGVQGLGEAITARGVAWHPLPIPDLGVPDESAMEAWRNLSPRLHHLAEKGGRILVHCRGGLGRAGTIAALLLIERGMDAAAAITAVRAARPGAIETDVQESWLAEQARRAAALHACLLGCAIGDSLGAEIEFLSLDAIRRRFPEGLTALPPHQGVRGAITDDTQMTLFTAEGLIRAYIRGTLKGICHPPSVVHHALLRWLETQGVTPRREIDSKGLVEDPRLHARRAPGNTCLAALAASERFGAPARNDSKGCGTIMRVAPVALMAPRERVHALAIETSALTHGHPTGQLAAAAWAEMIADVAAGAPLERTAERAAHAYARMEHGGETAAALRAALDAPRDGRAETVEALGGGWVAEEALAIALYACLSGDGFEDALRIAVTHGGDSDSTGAIAGAMLGVTDPAAVLAHRWAREVECADIAARLARDHALLVSDSINAERLWGTYPGW